MYRLNPASREPFFNQNDSGGLSVAYVNHEGVKIPLKSIKDLKEATRSVKRTGIDRLDLIFYDGKYKSDCVVAYNKSATNGRLLKRQKAAMPLKNTSSNNSCQWTEDSLPEWFEQYMKKFKTELLKDLKSDIGQMVHEEFEKEKKLAETKLGSKPQSEQNEFPSPAKPKKKKKISDRDALDLFEKREIKLLKKIEKLHLSKVDRLIYPILYLEKLKNKAIALLEEKMKVLERGPQCKLRSAKKTWDVGNMYKKSALFNESKVSLNLQPGEEFSFTVNVLNNGTVPWLSPRMECWDSIPIFTEDLNVIDLPQLKPDQSVNITLSGKVSQKLGNFVLTYKLVDGSEEFGPPFTCVFVISNSKEKILTQPFRELNCDGVVSPVSSVFHKKSLVGAMDFEKNVTAGIQKKNKEKVEKRYNMLEDTDLLGLYANGDGNREMRLDNNEGEFEARGCELLESKKKKTRAEIIEEKIYCEIDSCKKIMEKIKQMDENVESVNFQSKTSGVETDSDSELSVIVMSEEDENFIFVPSHSESSESESFSEKKPSKVGSDKESNEGIKKSDEAIHSLMEVRPVKIPVGEIESEEVSTAEDCVCDQSHFTTKTKLINDKEFLEKARLFKPIFVCSRAESEDGATSSESLAENVSGRVSPKNFEDLDFPSEKTMFTASNNFPDCSFPTGETSSQSTKTKEKNGRCDTPFLFFDYGEFSPLQDKRRENIEKKDNIKKKENVEKKENIERKGDSKINLPTSDCYGRPIYAVRKDGYCLPMKNIVENIEGVPNAESKEETQNKVTAETSKNCKANAAEGATFTIPNVLMNGASNVASVAFNTAKSVINNLQSALKSESEVTPRDTTDDIRQTQLANNFKYIEATLTLHEMGFLDHELNFRLLQKYDNHVNYVINEILDNAAVETSPNAK